MSSISFDKGSKVMHGGVQMRVVAAIGFDEVSLQSDSGEYFRASIAELKAEAQAGRALKPTSIFLDARRAEKVPAYRKALGPFLDGGRATKERIKVAADELGISVASAYAAIARYKEAGTLDVLPPPTRNGGRGGTRTNPAAEKIIQQCLEEILLNRRSHKPNAFFKEARKRLAAKNMTVSQATLRKRVQDIPDYKWTKTRKGYNEAQRTRDAIRGSYPDVLKPLDVIQIDHWKADIEVLSDDRLTSIGRVWITLAIDVYSRMVYGMHVALDPPGETTLGMAMINGGLRKDAVAEAYGITWDNPIAGPIGRLEADNAGEFRGNSILATADHFGFRLKWRPLGKPQYGAHIERLNKTLADRFRELPGATGSTAADRKDLRPEATAALTLEDLTQDAWRMVDQYHNEVHTGIDMTPLEKFKGYFFGPNGQKHRLPRVYIDNLDFRMHWYPLKTRSIQRYGIRIDHLDYYNEKIEHLVRNRKNAGSVQVRRNPLDVREIYMLHPTLQEWIVLPTRHLGFPTASIFEMKAAKRAALARKRAPTPENLARIVWERQEHLDAATKKTKSAQREHSRMMHHGRQRSLPGTTAAGPDAAAGVQLAPAMRSADPDPRPPVPRPPAPRPVTAPPDENLAAILAGITDDDIEEDFS